MTTLTAVSHLALTKFKEDIDRHVTGHLITEDSRGERVLLHFVVDMGMESVELSLDGQPDTYLAFNDRILPDHAPDEAFGYVVVLPIHDGEFVREQPVSTHFWTEADFKALEKHVLDRVFARWETAQSAAKTKFSQTLLGAE